MTAFTESVVEQATLAWLESLGWRVTHCAHRHPKLGCAERIVLARIKEVWIGIEDPDPTVDRKGIKYLQDSGVTVHMFDRDLQEEIQKANKVFIEQALQWIRDKLPNPIERSAARRQQVNEALFELVREGVVNALVHRDYAIESAKCQLVVTPDTITVKSPGKHQPRTDGTDGLRSIRTIVPTKCRDTARRPPCRAESRQISRQTGGIGVWTVVGAEP